TVFGVPRQRADRANGGGAGRVVRTGSTETVAPRQARVRRLYPSRAIVEGEVDTRQTNASGEWARRIALRITRFQINKVVGPGRQNIRMVSIDGKSRFVLLIL